MTESWFHLGYRKAVRPCALRVSLLIALVALCYGLRHASAQTPKELHIAAAADLQPVLPTLAAAYERSTGVKIITSFGSSATLSQQLINGDPQDIFLSADSAHAEQIIAAGLASETTPTPYARGVLVLWARNDSPAQPLALDVLTSPEIKRIAIANPLHAPYGLAATKALASLHLTEKLAGKLVVAENIAQTAQFAESGNAQVGLISLTIASSSHYRALGSFVRFPVGSYPEIRQSAIILKNSKQQAAAEDFLRWLTSKDIQQSFPKYGLDPAT